MVCCQQRNVIKLGVGPPAIKNTLRYVILAILNETGSACFELYSSLAETIFAPDVVESLSEK